MLVSWRKEERDSPCHREAFLRGEPTPLVRGPGRRRLSLLLHTRPPHPDEKLWETRKAWTLHFKIQGACLTPNHFTGLIQRVAGKNHLLKEPDLKSLRFLPHKWLSSLQAVLFLMQHLAPSLAGPWASRSAGACGLDRSRAFRLRGSLMWQLNWTIFLGDGEPDRDRRVSAARCHWTLRREEFFKISFL